MSTVLVGVDGSEAAARALAWAITLARRGAAQRLVVATVYVTHPASARSWDAAHDDARAQLDEWCAPVRVAAVPYDAVVLDGEAGLALLGAGERRDEELTVVSRRGCGGVDPDRGPRASRVDVGRRMTGRFSLRLDEPGALVPGQVRASRVGQAPQV